MGKIKISLPWGLIPLILILRLPHYSRILKIVQGVVLPNFNGQNKVTFARVYFIILHKR